MVDEYLVDLEVPPENSRNSYAHVWISYGLVCWEMSLDSWDSGIWSVLGSLGFIVTETYRSYWWSHEGHLAIVSQCSEPSHTFIFEHGRHVWDCELRLLLGIFYCWSIMQYDGNWVMLDSLLDNPEWPSNISWRSSLNMMFIQLAKQIRYTQFFITYYHYRN